MVFDKGNLGAVLEMKKTKIGKFKISDSKKGWVLLMYRFSH